MRDFINRVISRMHKLDAGQINKIFHDVAMQNDRLSMALDSLHDGVLVADNAHRLVLCNKPARRMLNISSAQIGKQTTIWNCISDVDMSVYVRENLLSMNREQERDFNFETSNGRTIILSSSIAPLVRLGKIQGSIFFITDVTEKRQQEAQLRRAENLAALTTLAAGVAHEIKNPLASISIHVQLMQKTLRNKKNINIKFLERYIEIVNEEVDRLNNIVVDFLFSVRPMDISLKITDFNQILTDIFDFVKYELKLKKIKLKRQLDSGIPHVALDARYFKQAILNLIKNAMSAMPDGGELVISTGIVEGRVCFTLTDTGRGMSKDTINKIFEPYYSTNEDGSGLGMTFVYKIMKEHGADVTIASQIDAGTSIFLWLPIPQSEKHLIQ